MQATITYSNGSVVASWPVTVANLGNIQVPMSSEPGPDTDVATIVEGGLGASRMHDAVWVKETNL